MGEEWRLSKGGTTPLCGRYAESTCAHQPLEYMVRLRRDDGTHVRHLDVRNDEVTTFLGSHDDDRVLLLRIDTS